jgi:predicted amidohydrolase
VINIDGVECSVRICMDIVDPLPLRTHASRGIQLILGPAAVSVDFLRTLHKARALENQTLSVFCNRRGVDPADGTVYLGNSAIFFPDGREQGLPSDHDGLVKVTLRQADLDAIDDARRRLLSASMP